jgi:hypothetical protein
MIEPPRRFPAPWHVEPMPGGYVVRDANGRALAYLLLPRQRGLKRGRRRENDSSAIATNRRQAPVAERPKPRRQLRAAFTITPPATSAAPTSASTAPKSPQRARQRRHPLPAGSFSEGFRTTAPQPRPTSSMGRRPKPCTTPEIDAGLADRRRISMQLRRR